MRFVRLKYRLNKKYCPLMGKEIVLGSELNIAERRIKAFFEEIDEDF